MVSYPNLKASVLKAGHHGSKGSSSEAFWTSCSPPLPLFQLVRIIVINIQMMKLWSVSRNVTLRFYEQTRTVLSVLRGGLSGQVKLSDNC